MVRQHEVPRLPYEIDLCLIVHKLVTEVDEDGHVYYGEEKHQIRQKLIENLGFIFIRINPNVEKFDLNVEMANICNYINESPVRHVVNLTESLKNKRFSKELLSYMSSVSKPLKHIRYFIKKILPTI